MFEVQSPPQAAFIASSTPFSSQVPMMSTGSGYNYDFFPIFLRMVRPSFLLIIALRQSAVDIASKEKPLPRAWRERRFLMPARLP